MQDCLTGSVDSVISVYPFIMYEPLATDLRPTTDAVLTIRVIKSFEFRTFKALILRGLDLETLTVGELLERCKNGKSRLAPC